jgi:predicted PurR-regulated permease PerM
MNEEIARKTIQEMMDKEKNNKAKKSLKDTMSDLYQNFGLILGFVVFMLSLGVIFGFVTYTIVGIRQMLDKINKAFPKAKKEPKKQDNIVA